MQILSWGLIALLYSLIGIFTAIGSITLSRKLLKGTKERAFYGLFLILIALFYLPFVGYFDNLPDTTLEISAVLLFSLLGILGMFNTKLLIFAYLAHGIWDLLHEFKQMQLSSEMYLDLLTQVPMAYGFFCLTFDFVMAGYFFSKRNQWAENTAAKKHSKNV